jgi:hypothetical protein
MSSLVMVSVAEDGEPSVMPEGPESATFTVSFGSTSASSSRVIVRVLLVSPAANEIVPEADK